MPERRSPNSDITDWVDDAVDATPVYGLHFNEAGYALWTSIVRPHLSGHGTPP